MEEIINDIQSKIKAIRKDILLTSNHYLACEIDNLIKELIKDFILLAVEKGHVDRKDVELLARNVWASVEVI